MDDDLRVSSISPNLDDSVTIYRDTLNCKRKVTMKDKVPT